MLLCIIGIKKFFQFIFLSYKGLGNINNINICQINTKTFCFEISENHVLVDKISKYLFYVREIKILIRE